MFGKVISIELGPLTSRICELDYKKKSPRIYGCISFDTPEGSYDDGYIMDKNILATIIIEKIKEAGIRSKRLVFSLMSTKIANREVIIPLIKKERIQDVVMANGDEYFPMDISGHTITYSILEKLNIDAEKKLRIMVLAAPDNMISEYYELAKLLEYELASIDYMGNSVYQLSKNHIDNDTNMVIYINEQMTILNILDKGTLTLSRVINYGSMNIFGPNMKGDNISISEAETLGWLYEDLSIRESYLVDEVAASAELPVLNLRESVKESLSYLIEHIGRILDYSSRNDNKRIKRIYIIGQGTNWKGMKEYLTQELGIEVLYLKMIDPNKIRKNLHVDREELSRYISCLGATIEPVKFIPRDYHEKNLRISNMNAIIFTFTSAVVISILIILISLLSYKNEQHTNSRLRTEIGKLDHINEVYREHHLISEKLNQLETIYYLTICNNEYFNDLLEEIEECLPSMAIVDSINVTSQGLVLSLVADSEVTAAATLQQLKSIQSLSRVSTSSINISEDEYGLKNVNFLIEARYDEEKIQSSLE